MNKTKPLIFIISILATLELHAQIERTLIKFGIDFLSNPVEPFFNLTIANVDFVPSFPDKTFQIKTNFFPTTLPLTYANVALKLKIYGERKYIPQIDLIGNYNDFPLLAYIPAEVKPQTRAYSYGLILSKYIDSDIKIFSGMKFTTFSFYLKLKPEHAIKLADVTYNEFNIATSDIFFFTGIQGLPPEQASLVASIGYGFKYNKLVLRLAIVRKYGFEFGFDFFPESLISIWPRVVICLSF